MKLPLSWLKHHVALTDDVATIATHLVRLGHEVEGVEEPRAAVKGVRVGHIVEKIPHPDADKLSLLKVDIGEAEPLAIVCGASNMNEGDRVPVATIGTVLPNGLTIRQGNIRGETSFGMCCSEVELGLADESAGLLILPGDAPIGVEVGEFLQLEEAVFDLSITPNRGDCMSVRGLARDLAADSGLALADVSIDPVPADASVSVPHIVVESGDDCPLYLGRRIEGVRVSDSPAWVQARLIAAGQRPVNGVVDVLNMIMLDLGQPMHAFDADRLSGRVSIRTSGEGEPFEALDGRKLALPADDLVVADESSVVALAGIMGSGPSGVTEATVNIMLESAFFRPARVSETRRHHAMVSEASMRFERGVDPAMVAEAMEQATTLILELFGGRAGAVSVNGSADAINTKEPLSFDFDRIEKRLGIKVPEATDAVLSRMGFGVSRSQGRMTVSIPSHRHDVSIPEDISEEYARIIGFDAVPEVLPTLAVTKPARADRSIADAVGSGFVQAISYAFISAHEQRMFTPDDGSDIVLANPISEAMAVMRRSGWPGLLGIARHNMNRQQPGAMLVEQGRTYEKGGQQGHENSSHRETNIIAWLMCGEVQMDTWHGKSRNADFFDMKGALESWLAFRGLSARFMANDDLQGLQAGQSAELLIGKAVVGSVGKVDAAIADHYDIDLPLFVAGINLDALPAGKIPRFQPLPEFPGVERDLVFLFDKSDRVDAILQAVQRAGGNLLTDAHIFDRYVGQGVPEGKVSLGIRFTLQDAKRTLTQEDSDGISASIVAAMEKQFSAPLRG
ncbi:MAG: phenylalanine--tRNA ligase subunit beta [Mariprofundaceae bacterium]|nr:phenylalanine--tRNA ligase subunit beta [Mariprofundaceae bacterium]